MFFVLTRQLLFGFFLLFGYACPHAATSKHNLFAYRYLLCEVDSDCVEADTCAPIELLCKSKALKLSHQTTAFV